MTPPILMRDRKFEELNFRSALVIEEADLLRYRIILLLRRQGWIVHGVKQAEQALPILTQIPYHLIVVDSELPGMSGIDFVRILHTSREWRTIPLMIITSSLTEAFATKVREFDAFLAGKSNWEADLSSILVGLSNGLPEGIQYTQG
ncbi:MAG: response regulator [Chthoniobacterales bacterium]